MNSWSPLSDGIVDSSIWEEPDHVFRVFIGMLSIKGPGDLVMLDSYKLHRRFHMEHGLVLDALKVLSSPDTKRPGQPHEGRRVEAVDGGWMILNGAEYREKARVIMKRARDARAQANYRAKKAGKPLPYPRVVKSVVRELTEEDTVAHEAVASTGKANYVAMQNLNEVQRRLDAEAEAEFGNCVTG